MRKTERDGSLKEEKKFSDSLRRAQRENQGDFSGL